MGLRCRSLEWNKKDFAAIVLPDGIDAAIAAAFGRVQEILFDPANVKCVRVSFGHPKGVLRAACTSCWCSLAHAPPLLS